MCSNNLAKVTVIIPCYNREKFIRQTVDSVFSQTYENLEIVAVDDGSTDSTREILDSYGDRIKILEHPGRANKGQSAVINLGIRFTQSKYIAILDSDDLFCPKKIEHQVKFLEMNKDFGLVYSNGFAIDEAGQWLYNFYSKEHKETNQPEKVLLDCYFLVPNNSLIRRTTLERAGEFDESLRAAQDHDMAIRLAEVTKLGYMDEFLFCYRRHRDSISSKNAILRWENGFRILKKASKRYKYGFNVIRRRMAVLNFRVGQCYLEQKLYLKAFIFFTFAGLCDPIRSFKVLIREEKITSPH